MGWSTFLSETRRVELDASLPSDEICSCCEQSSLFFDPNSRQYLGEGTCDTAGICACISIEKHKSRSSTLHFLRAERNRKTQSRENGPLDRFLAFES